VSTQKASVKKAFTLTELLVSMAVLGLIATLTLPHMFMSVDRAKKRTVFKEAFQALQQATQQAALEGGTRKDVIKLLNVKQICPNDAFTEGCTTLDHHETREPGIILSTGVGIYGLNPDTVEVGVGDGIIIALEEFPKKDYFYVFSNFSPDNLDLSWLPSRTDLFVPSLGWTPVTPVLRPGELKCVEQSCLDMFKND